MRFTASSLRGRTGRAGILILSLLAFAGGSAFSIPVISHAARARVAAFVSHTNPSPVAPISSTKKLSLTTKDLIYDTVSQRIYASTPGSAGNNGNFVESNEDYNEAFVVMQYFGYLRRDSDALYPDWIQVLDTTGDFRGMVNGFMNSAEYRLRFGP